MPTCSPIARSKLPHLAATPDQDCRAAWRPNGRQSSGSMQLAHMTLLWADGPATPSPARAFARVVMSRWHHRIRERGPRDLDTTPEPAGERTHDPEMVVQGRWTTQRSPTHECLTLKSTDSVQRCIERARAAGSSRDPFAQSSVGRPRQLTTPSRMTSETK